MEVTTPASNTLYACETHEVIRGSGYQIRIALPADDNISWTGAVGSGKIAKENGDVVFTFDAGTLTVEDDGSGTMIFSAEGTDTSTLTAGVQYYSSFRITPSASPAIETQTFSVRVYNSPLS